jgi:hypothetical protein
MSYGRLNIWLRYADCSLITDCWRTDLVIKTCGGEPLVDMDPTVFERIKAKYADYKFVVVHDYQKEKRIGLSPDNVRGGRPVYHIEVDVPPGCYVVWTRVCYSGNEETNKVMVIVDCGGEVCVNLLLDAVETCSKEVFHPLLERAVEKDLPEVALEGAARVLMEVAGRPKNEVLAELGVRLKEVEDMAPRLREAVNKIKEIVQAIPDIKGA